MPAHPRRQGPVLGSLPARWAAAASEAVEPQAPASPSWGPQGGPGHGLAQWRCGEAEAGDTSGTQDISRRGACPCPSPGPNSPHCPLGWEPSKLCITVRLPGPVIWRQGARAPSSPRGLSKTSLQLLASASGGAAGVGVGEGCSFCAIPGQAVSRPGTPAGSLRSATTASRGHPHPTATRAQGCLALPWGELSAGLRSPEARPAHPCPPIAGRPPGGALVGLALGRHSRDGSCSHQLGPLGALGLRTQCAVWGHKECRQTGEAHQGSPGPRAERVRLLIPHLGQPCALDACPLVIEDSSVVKPSPNRQSEREPLSSLPPSGWGECTDKLQGLWDTGMSRPEAPTTLHTSYAHRPILPPQPLPSPRAPAGPSPPPDGPAGTRPAVYSSVRSPLENLSLAPVWTPKLPAPGCPWSFTPCLHPTGPARSSLG